MSANSPYTCRIIVIYFIAAIVQEKPKSLRQPKYTVFTANTTSSPILHSDQRRDFCQELFKNSLCNPLFLWLSYHLLCFLYVTLPAPALERTNTHVRSIFSQKDMQIFASIIHYYHLHSWLEYCFISQKNTYISLFVHRRRRFILFFFSLFSSSDKTQNEED